MSQAGRVRKRDWSLSDGQEDTGADGPAIKVAAGRRKKRSRFGPAPEASSQPPRSDSHQSTYTSMPATNASNPDAMRERRGRKSRFGAVPDTKQIPGQAAAIPPTLPAAQGHAESSVSSVPKSSRAMGSSGASSEGASGEVIGGGQGAKALAREAAQISWEREKMDVMLATGRKGRGMLEGAAEAPDDGSENKAHLVVMGARPPFLQGKVRLSRQLQMVPVVRDPTSDMAVGAKKGSHALQQARQDKEKKKMRQRFWEVGGNRMGKVIGVQGRDEEAEAGREAREGESARVVGMGQKQMEAAHEMAAAAAELTARLEMRMRKGEGDEEGGKGGPGREDGQGAAEASRSEGSEEALLSSSAASAESGPQTAAQGSAGGAPAGSASDSEDEDDGPMPVAPAGGIAENLGAADKEQAAEDSSDEDDGPMPAPPPESASSASSSTAPAASSGSGSGGPPASGASDRELVAAVAKAAAAGAAAGQDGSQVPKVGRVRTIAEVRRSLPVHSVREDLLRVIRDNQVVIVVGQTGSGKTTQMTQYLMEDGYGREGLMIGCTQPRRVAAMSVAKRVSQEVGCPLGDKVGYTIRFEDCTSSRTRIKYMTDGILMRESLRDPALDQYSCIVMDEAHERSLYTDVLFGIMRRVLRRRRDIRVVVTSATMDAGKFSRFFGGAPVFEIPGRPYKVDVHYLRSAPDDYVEAAVRRVTEIHLGMPAGDVLVFMTGQEDIETTCELVATRIKRLMAEDVRAKLRRGEIEEQAARLHVDEEEDEERGASAASAGLEETSTSAAAELGDDEIDLSRSAIAPIMVLPMYSQLPQDLQSKIFDPAPPGVRKVVVSTNIAETSLTVDGVVYVVDCGYCKLKVYNPRIGMDALQVTPVSQANANQRKGRAGRTRPGHCYRIFSEASYHRDLLPNQVPEIQRTNLANVVLLLKSLGVKDLTTFDFMDPPPQENVAQSLYQLWALGAVDDEGELTRIGKKMSEFPLDPPLSKMILVAEKLGCSADVAAIVSLLSVPQVFFRPRGREQEADAAKEKMQVPESDHLTLLNVLQLWERHGRRAAWAQQHYVHQKGLVRASEVLGQLRDVMRQQRVGFLGEEDNAAAGGAAGDRVRRALCSGYLYHSARAHGVEEYANLLTGLPCHLHPTSALRVLGASPDYVVYHELVYTSKEHMICVSAVDPEWLVEAGPRFFRLREGAGSRRQAIGVQGTLGPEGLPAGQGASAASSSASSSSSAAASTPSTRGLSVGGSTPGGFSVAASSRFSGLQSIGPDRLLTMNRWAAADAETPLITSGGLDEFGAGRGGSMAGPQGGGVGASARGGRRGGVGAGGTRQGIAAAMERLKRREQMKRKKTPRRGGL